MSYKEAFNIETIQRRVTGWLLNWKGGFRRNYPKLNLDTIPELAWGKNMKIH
jgi:hypothetical protein